MSLQIGQKTKPELIPMNKVSEQSSVGTIEITDGANVTNPAIGITVEKEKMYCFEFTLNGRASKNFTVTLKNYGGNNSEGREMPLKYFSTPGSGNHQVIFTPNSSEYDRIMFKIDRSTGDYASTSVGTSISNLKLFTMTNIAENIDIQKLGIQAPAGTIFCIDGEEIRIGRSKIYETNDRSIKNLGIVLKSNETSDSIELEDYIIIDYLYKGGQ